MDLSVLYGPCLVVLLTTRAKPRVTGRALGQLGQRWKDGELRPGVGPTRRGETSKVCCQELKAMMAPLTILDISLPPKHLTCSISKYTNKQTHIGINTQTPRDAWTAKEHRQESITQRPINPWLPTRTVSGRLLSTRYT